MSIRFAAAGSGECVVVARVLRHPGARHAANDMARHAHAQVGAGPLRDPMLVSTLRHFATHGLGAAQEARRLAQEAQGRNDQERYDHWLTVCRHLDRRMAASLEAGCRRRGR